MSALVKKQPALSLFVVAMILGFAPSLAVATGRLPPEAAQLGALSSSLAAIVLVVVEGRKGGLRELLGRILTWRVGIQWWVFALFYALFQSVAALYVFNLLGGPPVDWSKLPPLYTIIPQFFLLTIAAGIGEEFGWRGFLLPRLQIRHNALVSSLIVGGLWAAWHIPMFFIKGTFQYDLGSVGGLLPAILGFSLLVMVNSIQFSWVFNNTRGSVLLVAILHGASNTWAGYIDPFRGHFGGALATVAVSGVVSLVIVLVSGVVNLSRTKQRETLEQGTGQAEIAQPVNIGDLQPASRWSSDRLE